MIAREGLVFIFIGLAVTAVFTFTAVRYDNKLLFSGSVIFGLLTLFTIFFFRDPAREIIAEPDILLSPADGKIVAIDTLDNDPFIGGQALKVSIFLSVFDVHINRIPTTGTIDYVKYNPGKFFAAYEEKASLLNEQTEIGMTAQNGEKVIFKQIAGLIARRIICHLEKGQKVSAGDRFGLIKFGSRTDLIMPFGSELKIEMGQKVKGGLTTIGYLKKMIDKPESTGELNVDEL